MSKILGLARTSGAKIVIGAVALASTVAVGTVMMLAFSSDTIRSTASFTPTQAVAKTLDISGSYRVYMNGSTTPETTNDVTLKSGDVAVVKATITNNGAMSAWVRDLMFITEKGDYLRYCGGEKTAADFTNGVCTTEDKNLYPGGVSGATADDGANMTGGLTRDRVINGTGLNAELETIANAPTTLKADTTHGYSDSMFLGSNSYEIAWTFYYYPGATSTGDNYKDKVSFQTNALQYEGNNSAMPSVGTCNESTTPPTCTGGWADVVTSSVGL